MIPHHQDAVKMSAMVLNSDRPQLRNLAKTVIETQSVEIEQMRDLARHRVLVTIIEKTKNPDIK